MAQLTDPISGQTFQFQASTDGSTWTTPVGAVSVTPGGGDTITGSQNTVDGSAPLVTGGQKHAPETLEVRGVYNKTSSDLWDTINDAWEGARVLYLRYAPEGGIDTVVGNELYTATDDAGTAFAAKFQGRPTPPPVDAGAGGPALMMARFIFPKLTRSTTTTT